MNDPGSVHGLTAENILATFPIALQGDRDAMALAEVTARLLARRPGEIDRLRIYSDIYWLDEKLLDILAYDFKVDWWNPNYTLDEKRRTLADSWRVHKILGTKAAVETAIRDIYPETEVKEWFEYEGGKPYHFKLNIDLTDTFGDETRPWAVLDRVNFYKSLRSHLDEIVFTMTTKPAKLHIGGGVGKIVSMGVPVEEDTYDFQRVLPIGGTVGANASVGLPLKPDKVSFQQTLSIGGTVGTDTSVGLPLKPDEVNFQQALSIGGAVGVDTSIRVPSGMDSFDFQRMLPIGGTVGSDTSISIPAETDTLNAQAMLYAGGTGGIHSTAGISTEPDTPEFSRDLRTGGKMSAHTSHAVPKDTAPPPSTTILRTGGVCTIISNISKGE